MKTEAERRFHITSWRVRQRYLGGTDPHQRTVIDWLYRKKLLTANEHLAGVALALLLEWRTASFGAADSTVVFARKMLEGDGRGGGMCPLQIVAYEVPLLVLAEDDNNDASLIDVDQITNADTFNETIQERLLRTLCTRDELQRLMKLFSEALPERPDLLTILGHAVTERVGVRDLPYRDVPLLCSALYLLKEHWREHLLEEQIDAATGLFESCHQERKLAA